MTYKSLLLAVLLICLVRTIPALSITEKYDEITVRYPVEDSLIVKNMIKTFSLDLDNFHRKLGQYPELPIDAQAGFL